MTDSAREAARLLASPLQRSEPLHGGDLSSLQKIVLEDGRTAVVKTGPAVLTEAAMLKAIAASGAPAPEILAVTDSLLVLSFVATSGTMEDAWEDVGRALATLHSAAGTRYGWTRDYAFGSVKIENGQADDWPAFFGQRRLLVNVPHLPPPLARRVETLARDLPNRLPKHPRPALLHGDCWGGNVLVSHGALAAFIDPACYYGHAEVDVAMLGLFNRPGDVFEKGYGRPEPGAAERMPIYRLWPALVHLRLFGGNYRNMVVNSLAAAGV